VESKQLSLGEGVERRGVYLGEGARAHGGGFEGVGLGGVFGVFGIGPVFLISEEAEAREAEGRPAAPFVPPACQQT
jgi:hypothetical protein